MVLYTVVETSGALASSAPPPAKPWLLCVGLVDPDNCPFFSSCLACSSSGGRLLIFFSSQSRSILVSSRESAEVGGRGITPAHRNWNLKSSNSQEVADTSITRSGKTVTKRINTLKYLRPMGAIFTLLRKKGSFGTCLPRCVCTEHVVHVESLA